MTQRAVTHAFRPVLVPPGGPRFEASCLRPLCVPTCDLPGVGPGPGALRLATWRVAACDLAPVGLCRCKRGCRPNWQKACKSKQDAPAVRCAPEHACDDMTHAWACGRPPNCQRKCKCKQDAHGVLYAPCRSCQTGNYKQNMFLCPRKQHSAIQHDIHNTHEL
jgi:hypothetical protein